jgi:hypothetical protein
VCADCGEYIDADRKNAGLAMATASEAATKDDVLQAGKEKGQPPRGYYFAAY